MRTKGRFIKISMIVIMSPCNINIDVDRVIENKYIRATKDVYVIQYFNI